MLEYKKFNSWEEIKSLCEENKFKNCKLHDQTLLHFYKDTNNFIHFIKYDQNNIRMLNELPNNLDELNMDIFEGTDTKILANKFTNLPACLKQIKFFYKKHIHPESMEEKLSDIKTFEKNGMFNLLFGIKLPFDCKVTVVYADTSYNVKYSDKLDELELEVIDNTKKINYTNIKIKYISFVPLQFWFNQNAGLALPLIVLQYTDVKINVDFTNLG
jgi:hypothetical protein